MANWLLLLALILAIPTVNGWLNLRRHQANYRAASARGWRFAPVSLPAILRPRFVLAGKTPGGFVWEIARTKRESGLYLEWCAPHAGFSYGRLLILPQAEGALSAGSHAPLLRALPAPRKSWAGQYVLMATHEALAARYIHTNADDCLRRFAPWPAPGALATVDWQPAGLLIRCRYHADWATIDRIVALGVSLIDNTLYLPV